MGFLPMSLGLGRDDCKHTPINPFPLDGILGVLSCNGDGFAKQYKLGMILLSPPTGNVSRQELYPRDRKTCPFIRFTHRNCRISLPYADLMPHPQPFFEKGKILALVEARSSQGRPSWIRCHIHDREESPAWRLTTAYANGHATLKEPNLPSD